MANSKRKSNTLPYQTTKDGDRMTPLFWQMMESTAWGELSGNDIKVYLYMAKKVNTHWSMNQLVKTNKDDLSVPRNEYKGLDDKQKWKIKLSNDTFTKCIDHLINLGFVRVNGYKYMQGNKKVIIYGMNEMWNKYGTDDFKIKECWKREKERK